MEEVWLVSQNKLSGPRHRSELNFLVLSRIGPLEDQWISMSLVPVRNI